MTPEVMATNRYLQPAYLLGHPAAVIGNGGSRVHVDLDRIAASGTVVIGCNAVVRDADPDYVFFNDPHMGPILAGLNVRGPVYVTGRRHPNLDTVRIDGETPAVWNPFAHGTGNLSGIQAIALAAHLGCSPLYLIGFDENRTNVYDGTVGYHNSPVGPGARQGRRIVSVLKRVAETTHIPTPELRQIGPNTFPTAKPWECPEGWRAEPEPLCVLPPKREWCPMRLIPDGARVVDVGCRRNGFLNALHRRGGEWRHMGTDPAHRLANENAPPWRIPATDKAFDLSTAFNVLEHVPARWVRRTLREMRRVARRYVFSVDGDLDAWAETIGDVSQCEVRRDGDYLLGEW